MSNKYKNKPKKSNKHNKTNEQVLKYEYNNVSQDQMIEIHTEAYYRALKRIEQEKSEVLKKTKKNDKWYINLLFMLNIMFFPWKINKRFGINNRIYDSLLVLFVVGMLYLVGFLLWFFSVLAMIVEFGLMIKDGISSALPTTFSIILLMLFLGSTFILAGSEFNKETDSNKIYAFSACVIALISCAVGIIALIKM